MLSVWQKWFVAAFSNHVGNYELACLWFIMVVDWLHLIVDCSLLMVNWQCFSCIPGCYVFPYDGENDNESWWLHVDSWRAHVPEPIAVVSIPPTTCQQPQCERITSVISPQQLPEDSTHLVWFCGGNCMTFELFRAAKGCSWVSYQCVALRRVLDGTWTDKSQDTTWPQGSRSQNCLNRQVSGLVLSSAVPLFIFWGPVCACGPQPFKRTDGSNWKSIPRVQLDWIFRTNYLSIEHVFSCPVWNQWQRNAWFRCPLLMTSTHPCLLLFSVCLLTWAAWATPLFAAQVSKFKASQHRDGKFERFSVVLYPSH